MSHTSYASTTSVFQIKLLKCLVEVGQLKRKKALLIALMRKINYNN